MAIRSEIGRGGEHWDTIRDGDFSLTLIPEQTPRRQLAGNVRFDALLDSLTIRPEREKSEFTAETEVIMIQPHRDDVPLSTGDLLAYLKAQKKQVKIVTVMTEANDQAQGRFPDIIRKQSSLPSVYFAQREAWCYC